MEGALTLIEFLQILKIFHQWFSCISIELLVGSFGPFIPLHEIVIGRAVGSGHLNRSQIECSETFWSSYLTFKFNYWQCQGQSSARLVCCFNTEYFMLVAERRFLACRRCVVLKHAGLKELVGGLKKWCWQFGRHRGFLLPGPMEL